MSACEVVIPKANTATKHLTIAENVDRYLYTMPKALMSQIDLVFEVVEHLTLVDFQYKRFTRLNLEQRNAYLLQLNDTGGDLRLVYRTLRDFCMLGYYQQKDAWKDLSYAGPAVGFGTSTRQPKYSSLIAAAGQLPKAIVN
jgi:hypothetical protein